MFGSVQKITRYLDYYDNQPAPQAPADIANHIEQLSSVRRFMHPEYPDIFDDTTKTHTERCVAFAESLNIDAGKTEIVRTLWIHDIPEIIISDYTVVQKEEDPEFEKEIDRQEEHAAKSLLGAQDLERLRRFNQASDYARGKRDMLESPYGAALIAKVIDGFDGHITFQYRLMQWMNSDRFDQNKLPPKRLLERSMRAPERFESQIKKLPQDEARDIALDLLKQMDATGEGIWRNASNKSLLKNIQNSKPHPEAETLNSTGGAVISEHT